MDEDSSQHSDDDHDDDFSDSPDSSWNDNVPRASIKSKIKSKAGSAPP